MMLDVQKSNKCLILNKKSFTMKIIHDTLSLKKKMCDL